jgi:eukaryotic-like serine/threonine-protein kinase
MERKEDATGPADNFGLRYRIGRELGDGGMGVVYEATRDDLAVPVALKRLKPELFAAAGARILIERFWNESELLRSFSHPNIVRVIDVGVDDGGMPYIAMEVLTGGTLKDHLAYYRDNPEKAVRLVAIVARALHSIHEKDVVHRDMKPGNLMFRSDPTDPADIVVTDFGLGVVVSRAVRLTVTGHFMGTAVYSAPEQLVDAKHVDRRADVYSLGVILFQLLSGKLPVDPPARRVDAAYIFARRTTSARNLRNVLSGADLDLDSICRAALQPDPSGRFETASAFADELDKWSATR